MTSIRTEDENKDRQKKQEPGGSPGTNQTRWFEGVPLVPRAGPTLLTLVSGAFMVWTGYALAARAWGQAGLVSLAGGIAIQAALMLDRRGWPVTYGVRAADCLTLPRATGDPSASADRSSP